MTKVKRITKSTKKTHERVLQFYCRPQTGKCKTKNQKGQSNPIKLRGKKNEQEELKNLTFRRLNLLLMFTFEEVKKKTGEAYQPETLTDFQLSIRRHLKKAQRQIC